MQRSQTHLPICAETNKVSVRWTNGWMEGEGRHWGASPHSTCPTNYPLNICDPAFYWGRYHSHSCSFQPDTAGREMLGGVMPEINKPTPLTIAAGVAGTMGRG
ncbi:phosphatidylcholine-sterol acyltransferase [Platysternon megacephalum]|uniref:Phosphatidylcholine-sterol acyltransferase n=1 Tax=Platysternon megacephalum TaxID=55544 RepID=A0A4D9DYL3_9SAUR|nr:phosphatidylcholine-sterol acyltransferase [Platysternon megacephalum]